MLLAMHNGHVPVLRFLLDRAGDPAKADARGFTPLHNAAEYEDGELPIMLVAAPEQRELVEILFPLTKPVPIVPDWTVDGIIRTMKYLHFGPQVAVSVEEQIADNKSKGKEVFAKGDYLAAIHLYTLAMGLYSYDVTLFANRSLCWLHLKEGELALADAQHCKTLRPGWSKAWYCEGMALSFLEDYEGAVDAFKEALKLDPTSVEIKKVLREAMESTMNAARAGELKP
ncbi:hypothetical protein ACP4OV_022915 [Aristida adscensionis]